MSTIRKFYDLDIDQTSTPSPEAKGTLTAMQMLIDWMDDNKSHCTYGTIRQKATELLEVERSQLDKAYNDGCAYMQDAISTMSFGKEQ